jgi:predicted ATPase/DNA-binding winged helix-turn-helix (wHTH) protein
MPNGQRERMNAATRATLRSVRILELDEWIVDLEARRARRGGGDEVALTAQEVALLRYLAARAGETVPRAELFAEVLGYSTAAAASSRALDATVRRLRKKLEDDPDAPRHLQTDHGRGFCLVGLRAVAEPAAVPPPADPSFGPDAPLRALRAVTPGEVAVLVGPGGVGKSRLARRLAGEGGTWAWVAVPAGADASELVAAIAAALGLPASVRGLAALLRAVASVSMGGLVLDAAEVAIDAAAAVAPALAAHLRVVVTSRVRLGSVRERAIPVAPLPLADGIALLLHRAEARLGRPWASAADPAVAELVARSDGLPLALELAAARAPVLGPEELCRMLPDPALLRDDRRDVDPRHASLDAMIATSWGLLGEEEQRALIALSVFLGPFPPSAGIRVAGGLGPLEALVEHHLVRARGEDGRLVLFDTVRAFVARRAEERPWSAHRAESDRRYAACAELPDLAPRDRLVATRLALHVDGGAAVERAALLLLRPAPSADPPVPVPELLALAAQIVRDRPAGRDVHRVLVAAAGLATLASDRAEVDVWLAHLDAAAAADGPDRIRLEIAAAELASAAGRAPEAIARLAPGIDAPEPEGVLAAVAAATCHARLGELDRAAALLEPIVRRPGSTAPARSFDVPAGGALLARAEGLLGTVRANQARFDEGEALLLRARERWAAEGDRRGVASAVANLAGLWHRRGQLDPAVGAYAEAIELARGIGDLRACAACANNLAMIHVLRGDDDAMARLQEVVGLHRDLDAAQDLLIARANLHGAVLAHPDDRASAAEALAEVAREAESRGLSHVAALAWLYAARQLADVDVTEARAAADRAVARTDGHLQLQALVVRARVQAAEHPGRAADDLQAVDAFDDVGFGATLRAELAVGRAEIEVALGWIDAAAARLRAVDEALAALGLPDSSPLVRRAAGVRRAVSGS